MSEFTLLGALAAAAAVVVPFLIRRTESERKPVPIEIRADERRRR